MARGSEVEFAELEPVLAQLLVHLGERGGAEVLDAHELRLGAGGQVAQRLHAEQLERLADADGEVDVGDRLAQRALAAALERLEALAAGLAPTLVDALAEAQAAGREHLLDLD